MCHLRRSDDTGLRRADGRREDHRALAVQRAEGTVTMDRRVILYRRGMIAGGRRMADWNGGGSKSRVAGEPDGTQPRCEELYG